jgi:hypothetical protein
MDVMAAHAEYGTMGKGDGALLVWSAVVAFIKSKL